MASPPDLQLCSIRTGYGISLCVTVQYSDRTIYGMYWRSESLVSDGLKKMRGLLSFPPSRTRFSRVPPDHLVSAKEEITQKWMFCDNHS